MSEQKTIFEGLYQIDWENIKHFYGSNVPYQIPHAIRDLLSDNDNIREDARNFLFGDSPDGDRGLIDEATLHIVPFVFELLMLKETPEKHELLWDLAAMLIDPSLEQEHSTTAHYMRNYMAVYDLVEKNISFFLGFLKHDDSDICIGAIVLLRTLVDSREAVVSELVAQSQIETRHDVQVWILQGLIDLLCPPQRIQLEIYNRYDSFFSSLIETHSSLDIRYKAACIELEMYQLYRYRSLKGLSSQTASVLIDQFWSLYQATYTYIHQNRFKMSEEVLSKIIMLPDAVEILWQIIDDDRFIHVDTLNLLKWFLMAEFPQNTTFSYGPQLSRRLKKEPQYHVYQSLALHRGSGSGRSMLQKIADDDRFWHISTNTFSFFLGLPDARDELRAFLKTDKD